MNSSDSTECSSCGSSSKSDGSRESNVSSSGSQSGKRLFITLKPNARQTCYIFTRPVRVRVKGAT